MTETCRPAKCIEAIRIALLDQCTYLPICGPGNGYAMGCIIDPDWSPEIEEGDESIVKDNCGEICLQDIQCDITKRWVGEFKISRPDPEFQALIGADNLIVVDGQSVGVQITTHCSPWLFLELFERTDDCDTNGDPIYYRHIFPRARLTWTGNEKEGVFRLLQIEFKALDIPISDIGTGPYGDVPAAAITAPPNERSAYIEFQDTTIPTVQCGAIDVECPVVCEAPTVDSITTDCPTFTITGDCFDLVNQVQIEGCFGIDAYDPDGPDAGSTHSWLQVNQWDNNTIVIEVVNLNGFVGNNCELGSLTLFGPGGTPNYGTFAAPDLDCPDIDFMTSPACQELCFNGTGFDEADHVQLFGSGGISGTYYDPSGPNSGLNPGGFTVTWSDTQVCVIGPSTFVGTATGAAWFDVANNSLGSFPDADGPNVTVDECPPAPTVTDLTSPDCCTFEVTGTGFDQVDHIQDDETGVDYYDPAGPNAGLNPGTATVNIWNSTTINITDPGNCPTPYGALLHLWGIDDDPNFGNYNVPDVNIEACPEGPTVNGQFDDPATNSPECDRIQIYGTGFDQVNHIQMYPATPGPWQPYYDPAGPDAGLNPGTATINSWTPTLIDITDTAIPNGQEFGSLEMWGVGDTPYFGFFAIDGTITMEACPDTPIIGFVRAENCDQFDIGGGFLDVVNHVQLTTSCGVFDYYDPAGPDAGSNPGTATIDAWNSGNITVTDTALAGCTAQTVQMWGVGDTPDYGVTDFADFLIYDCDTPPVIDSADSPSCYRFEISGTNLDIADQINVQTDFGEIDYFNPVGSNPGGNPPTATILMWTALSIVIYDSQLANYTIQTIHPYGIGGLPDFGLFDGPDFLVEECPAPLVTAGSSPACDTIEVDGSNFSSVNHIQIVTDDGLFSYFDPAGPDAGLNPGFVTINSWTDTVINVTHNGLGNRILEAVHMWGIGNSPDYGIFDIDPDVNIDLCVPDVTAGSSPACDTIQIDGTRFDLVNHILVGPGLGTHFYDPAGPDAGLNPVGTVINAWTPTQISITYGPFGPGNSFQVHMWGLADSPDYGLQGYPNFLIANC